MAIISPKYTVRQHTTASRVDHVSFGVVDAKGRDIGALIQTFIVERIEDEAGYYASTWVGSKFAFSPQAARNGKDYGACQPNHYFDTAAERDAAIAKYLANAAKRAAKRAGK